MNLKDQQFGHLTVRRKGEPYPSGPARWWCYCSLCDTEKLIGQRALMSGASISCGCKRQMRLSKKLCPKHNTPCVRRTCPPNGFRCPLCINERRRSKYRRDHRSILLNSARHRARVFQVPFDLTKDDISIPEMCPILGIKLEVGTRLRRDNSPSLDRLKPELGYVRGNVRVISYRANRIKSDGTREEHEQVVAYMRESGL